MANILKKLEILEIVMKNFPKNRKPKKCAVKLIKNGKIEKKF